MKDHCEFCDRHIEDEAHYCERYGCPHLNNETLPEEDFSNDHVAEYYSKKSWDEFNKETFVEDAKEALKGTGFEDRNPLFQLQRLVEHYRRVYAAYNDQQHFEGIARRLDRENVLLKKAFEIMYQHIFMNGLTKGLTKSESELLLSLKFPKHGKTF